MAAVGFDARLAESQGEILAAFVAAMEQTECTQAEAARGMRLTPNTVTNYVTGHTPVNVARVLAFPKLEKAFRVALCAFDHSVGSAPYIAKRKRSR